jgi:hypothetical protein
MASESRRDLCVARRELAAAEDRARRTAANRKRSDAKDDAMRRLATLTEQTRARVAEYSIRPALENMQAPQQEAPRQLLQTSQHPPPQSHGITSILIQTIMWVIVLLHALVDMLRRTPEAQV